MIFADECAHMGHPCKVGLTHESAPLTYQQRRGIVFVDIEPVIMPAVLHQRIIIIISLKPGLFVYRRAVVMR